MPHREGGGRIILVHGAVERASGFDEVVGHLEGLDVVTYDRRGHGDRWTEGPTSLTTDVDELAELLDERPATVVAHSIGGLVAMGACLRNQGRVRSLGLYETAVPWAGWWSDDERAAMLSATEANVTAARARDAEDRERLVVAWQSCLNEVRDALGAPFRWEDLDVPLTTGRGSPIDQPSSRDAVKLAEALGGHQVLLDGAGHRGHRTDPVGFAGFVRSSAGLGVD